MMPLFLVAFFGLIWAMKDSSLSARAALAVRYGGMVDSLQQPYVAYSLYDVYATIDNVVPAANTTCYPGDASQLTAGYHAFWLPNTTAALVTPCATKVAIISSPETYTQPVMLRNDYASITATAPVGGYLTSALHGSTTTVRAAENFFRGPDVGTIMTCTTIGAVIKASLEGKSDTAVPTSLSSTGANAMPYTPATAGVVTGTTGSCGPTTSSFTAPAAPY